MRSSLGTWHVGCRFNPRPALRPGDAAVPPEGHPAGLGFNPRPALRPGDAAGHEHHLEGERCFNPRPALRPGDAVTLGGSPIL